MYSIFCLGYPQALCTLASQLLSAEEQDEFLGSKPRIGEWMVAVRDALAPHWDDVHAKMMTVAKDAEAWRSVRASSTSL